MANSARRSINYNPRYTDAEALELLPPQVRHALYEAVTEYSASGCLRYCKKWGWKRTVEWIKSGDRAFIAKGWIPAKGFHRPKVESPCVTHKVPPLYANWPKP